MYIERTVSRTVCKSFNLVSFKGTTEELYPIKYKVKILIVNPEKLIKVKKDGF